MSHTACLKLIYFAADSCFKQLFHFSSAEQLPDPEFSREKQFSLVKAIMITTCTGSAIYVNISIFSPLVELYTVNFSFPPLHLLYIGLLWRHCLLRGDWIELGSCSTSLCCHSHNRWYLSVPWESVLNSDVLLIACWLDLSCSQGSLEGQKKDNKGQKRKIFIYLVLFHPVILIGKENSGWM